MSNTTKRKRKEVKASTCQISDNDADAAMEDRHHWSERTAVNNAECCDILHHEYSAYHPFANMPTSCEFMSTSDAYYYPTHSYHSITIRRTLGHIFE